MTPVSFDCTTYQGPQDLDRMAAMIVSSWQRQGVASPVHLGNLGWRLARIDLTRPYDGIAIWTDANGRTLGFSLACDPYPIDLLIEPAMEGDADLLMAMLDWNETRWSAARRDGRKPSPLRIACKAKDGRRQETLTARGYAKGEKTYIRHTRPIAASDAKAQLPAGFTMRNLSLPDDSENILALHNTVFDIPEMTADDYRRVTAAPWHSFDLHCVVENAEGELVCFALGWIDRRSGTLEFEPVGCHPAWRRRGLTGAAMGAVMARAARDGATLATVTARGENAETLAFYRALGFEQQITECEFVW